MKRFLNTAYNNLKERDSSFESEYLLELKDGLNVLSHVYQDFIKKIEPLREHIAYFFKKAVSLSEISERY